MATPLLWTILENRQAQRRQTAWCSIGLPRRVTGPIRVVAGTPGREIIPSVVSNDGMELHVRPTIEAGQRVWAQVLSLTDSEAGPRVPFKLHPHVGDDIPAILPSFQVDGRSSQPLVTQRVSNDDARERWSFRTAISGLPMPLWIDGWFDIYSDSPVIEWSLMMGCGSTVGGEPLRMALGSVSMFIGEQPVIDFALSKGLHIPMWRQDLSKWEAEVAPPRNWMRSARVFTRGALLCVPQPKFIDAHLGAPESQALLARTEGTVTGIVSPADWNGKFGAFGKIPETWGGMTDEQIRRADLMNRRLRTSGSEEDPRPYGQPPNAGQTGEQPDFGAARAEHVLGHAQSWGIYDLMNSVEAWAKRPYYNREPNGDRVTAARHPGTQLYQLRPDHRFGTDHLGWPLPVPYIGSWDTSDAEHRSDNLFWAMWQLTRHPAIASMIEDRIELEKMELWRGGIGAPRAVGRQLVSHCHGLASNFRDYETFVRRLVTECWNKAQFRTTPNDAAHTVRVLSSDQSKYGWVNPDGTSIRAWLPWQESIAAMGFYAAWEQLQIHEAAEMCVEIGRTIALHGFYEWTGAGFHCCYAVRWRTDDPGAPLPQSAYNPNQPNYDVFTYGMQRWTILALLAFRALAPNDQVGPRAQAIIDNYRPPRDWADSCWWAL